MADVLLIENCDFKSHPVGGQLFFARQMMKAFQNHLALVGVCTDSTPVGRWVEKEIDEIKYSFFCIGRRQLAAKKPIIPERLRSHFELRYYKKRILSLGIKNIFTQAPELLMAVDSWKLDHLCYQFPGTENPLMMPRYRWGKILAGLFDKKFFTALSKADTMLACADKRAIQNIANRSFGTFSTERVIQFPTRVDTTLFFPSDKTEACKLLGLPLEKIILISTGRINRVKGWDFILKSFYRFKQNHPNSFLVFLGDGEDREALEKSINEFQLTDHVVITGFQPSDKVARYLNAADISVVGSDKEGWSLAMLEALACGKPIVSTDVSGARDMIIEGVNGYIVTARDPLQYANAISKTMHLQKVSTISNSIAQKYALSTLQRDLATVWEPLA